MDKDTLRHGALTFLRMRTHASPPVAQRLSLFSLALASDASECLPGHDDLLKSQAGPILENPDLLSPQGPPGDRPQTRLPCVHQARQLTYLGRYLGR